MAGIPVTTKFADSPRNGAWGDRPYAIIDWQGPTFYNGLIVGAGAGLTPTGGQPIVASNLGLTAPIEGIFPVSGSLSGRYFVIPYQTTTYNQGQANSTWALQWIDSVNGAEVTVGTDLSSEVVRLVAFGPY